MSLREPSVRPAAPSGAHATAGGEAVASPPAASRAVSRQGRGARGLEIALLVGPALVVFLAFVVFRS